MTARFVARKHGALLDGDVLPLKPPDHVPRRAEGAWKAMRHAQRDYQEAASAGDRRVAALAFAEALEEFTDARASRHTLAQMLLVTIIGPVAAEHRGPGGSVPIGVDPTEWRKAMKKLPAWERRYGAAWRLRNGLGLDADKDSEVEVDHAAEIPDPPGLDLFG